MIELKDSHDLCHRTHALFKFKQVVVTYIRTLPSTPSQLPVCRNPFRILGDTNTAAGRPARPHHDVRCPPLSSTSRARSFWLLPRATRAWRCVVDPGDGTPQPCCKVVTGKQGRGSISRHGYGCEFHLPFGVCVNRCVCPYVCPSIWFSVCS